MLDRHVAQAAARAGLALQEAKALLEQPEIIAEIDRRRALLAIRHPNVTLDRVIDELAALSFSSMRDFLKFDKEGQPYFALDNLTPLQMAAVQSLDIEEWVEQDNSEWDADGEPLMRRVRKIKLRLHNKTQALVDLGRHLGLKGQPDKVGGDTILNQFNQVVKVEMQLPEPKSGEDRSYRDITPTVPALNGSAEE